MSIMHNGEKVLNNLTTVPITQTINASSTETQIPSAKAVYDNAINGKNLKTYTNLSQMGLTEGSETLSDIATNMENESTAVLSIHANCNVSEYPIGYGVLVVNKLNIYRVSFIFTETGGGAGSIRQWFASYNSGKINGWKRVVTTTVDDVPLTSITALSDETNYAIYGSSSRYMVKDGWCEVTLYIKAIAPDSGSLITLDCGLPKSQFYRYFNLHGWDNVTTDFIDVEITNDGGINFKKGTANGLYIGSFSYKVAES